MKLEKQMIVKYKIAKGNAIAQQLTTDGWHSE